MKPHFGQSDAAMNKLAGCNSFPNAGKTFDLTELEQMAREAGCETPFEYLSYRDKRIQQNIDSAAQGYYGHELGCDCAICEDVAQRERFRKTADAEWNKLMDENKRYCDALHIIAHMGVSGLSWQYDFEKCVNIANEALGLARKNL